MTDPGASFRPVAPLQQSTTDTSGAAATACPFCLEEIRVGASVCKRCGSNVAPLHQLILARVALEERLAAVETELATLRQARPDPEVVIVPPPVAGMPPRRVGWPHMVDNLFLGLAALLAAHWLASTVPEGQQALSRLVALCVALPFGFRYEVYARAGASAQIVAALFYGVLGALLIVAVDAAISGGFAQIGGQLHGRELVASVAAIGLSHLTGSCIAWWSRRDERRAGAAASASRKAVSAALLMLLRTEPEKLKGRIDALHGLIESGAPVAAAAATAWAAFGRLLF